MSEPCTEKESIGRLKEAVENLTKSITRLDDRVNGTFEIIGKHIEEAPTYRSKIEMLEREVEIITREKLSSIKQSQWRIGIISGSVIGIFTVIINLILRLIGK